MSRNATAFVLGYHGCDLDLARQVVLDETGLTFSRNRYDWLGEGIYFWEADPRRAWEWADEREAAGKIGAAGVIGAAIDLGNCLDLLARENIELVAAAYDSLQQLKRRSGERLPRNRAARGGRPADRLLRIGDCEVINHLHRLIDDGDGGVAPFDTVRGVFVEGERIFPTSGFHRQTHVQVAVRRPAAIKGVFLAPRPA